MGKITKDISKLTKLPHPNSRKTAKLAKKIVKQDHRTKTKQGHAIRMNLAAERYAWFKTELCDADTCSPDVLLSAIVKFLARFDDELEQIQLKHEIGGKRNRQHANREDIIKVTKSNEEEEFRTSGIELPDVLNAKQFSQLKTWNGEMRFLQNFKLTRFNKTRLDSLIAKPKKEVVTKTQAVKSTQQPAKSMKKQTLKMECD